VVLQMHTLELGDKWLLLQAMQEVFSPPSDMAICSVPQFMHL